MRGPVSFLCRGTDAVPTEGLSVDISWNGMCIVADTPCTEGTTLTISLPLPNGNRFERNASVQWCRFDDKSDKYLFGSRFH